MVVLVLCDLGAASVTSTLTSTYSFEVALGTCSACSLPGLQWSWSMDLQPCDVALAPYGPAWRELWRFSVSTLRNFSLGKKSLEQWVTEEAACLCAAFASQDGRPFLPNTLLSKAVCNVIASLIYARRFEYEDPGFMRMMDLLEDSLKEDSGLVPQVLNAVPMLLCIPGVSEKALPAQKAFLDLLDELLTEHRTTRDPAQPP
ncbi:cytochrome P450 2D17-like [Cavia porcellus]|uniref:cytochrome P450 2D17-like n=1 Tax=Cavia porcellus TaxID=10141 RepID=UPI002FDF1D35